MRNQGRNHGLRKSRGRAHLFASYRAAHIAPHHDAPPSPRSPSRPRLLAPRRQDPSRSLAAKSPTRSPAATPPTGSPAVKHRQETHAVEPVPPWSQGWQQHSGLHSDFDSACSAAASTAHGAKAGGRAGGFKDGDEGDQQPALQVRPQVQIWAPILFANLDFNKYLWLLYNTDTNRLSCLVRLCYWFFATLHGDRGATSGPGYVKLMNNICGDYLRKLEASMLVLSQ